MKTSFANLVRGGASARSFSLQTTRADAAILAVLAAAAGCAAFLFANETAVLWRALVALQAAVAAGALRARRVDPAASAVRRGALADEAKVV